jgi:transcriptional regulator with XRE-family HTH domain
MEPAGEKLKRVRQKLKLTYRDVEQASLEIARRRRNDEFAIALSRLSDIENKGTVPTIYRLYSLCAIYRLDFDKALHWYGVPRQELAAESMEIGLDATHVLQVEADPAVTVPLTLDTEVDLEKTTFLGHLLKKWGILPLNLLQKIDVRKYRYGWIGLQDWSMYPILTPGSLVVVDESRRKIAAGGWINEFDRPIYFLEHREGYICGWCMPHGGQLVIQHHPASQQKPVSFPFPGGIDVVGQVTAVAMRLDSRAKHPVQNATGV